MVVWSELVSNKYLLSVGIVTFLYLWMKCRHPQKKFHLPTEKVGVILRVINVIGDVSKALFFGWSPFSVKKKQFLQRVKQIAAKTDKEIFGPQDQYVEGVEKFLNGLREDLFSASGTFLLNGYIDRLLNTRNSVIQYIQSHKEILESEFDEPVIICGLPRTGSTMLYNLLSCDPNSRVPRFFEMSQMGDIIPPVTSEAERNTHPRIKQVMNRFDEIERQYPHLFTEAGKSHYSHPNEIEEDLLVMFHSFVLQLHVPCSGNEYRKWYENEDNKDFAYRYHRRFFQLLNYYWKPQSHWVLKAPVHTTYLNALYKQYPKAKLVFTHRDPCEVVPSWTRLLESYSNWNYNNYACDRIEYGRYMTDSLVLCADRLMEFTKDLDNSAYIDVVYEDMIKDPIAMVRSIYDHFGLTFTEEFKVNMEKWIKENRQGKHGRREYSLADYNLTPKQIKQEFAEYNEHYKIPSKIKE